MQTAWYCPNCGTMSVFNFCGRCGCPKPVQPVMMPQPGQPQMYQAAPQQMGQPQYAQQPMSQPQYQPQAMQQAYQQANEVVELATKQAQQILDTATNEANTLRMNAANYTDEQLSNLQEILSGALESSKSHYEGLRSSLQGFLDVVASNREEMASMLGKGEKSDSAKKDTFSGDGDGGVEDADSAENSTKTEEKMTEKVKSR